MFLALDADMITEAKANSNLENGKNILSKLKLDKQYYLSVGKHVAIVRKIKKPDFDSKTMEIVGQKEAYQYLEIQELIANGWFDFGEDVRDTLVDRFGCTYSSEEWPVAYATDISQLNVPEFRTMLGYINTAEKNQRKVGFWYGK